MTLTQPWFETADILTRRGSLPGVAQSALSLAHNAVAQGDYVSSTLTTTGSLIGLILPIKASDLAVGGYTTKLRICGHIWVNATAPTSTFQLKLCPVTSLVGGVNALTGTVGASVLSTSTVAAPASGSTTRFTPSADSDLPADGDYILVNTISVADMAANSLAMLRAWIEISYTL